MITESFLNSCFTLVLNKSVKIKRTKALYQDVLDVLQFSENKSPELPYSILSKLECLKRICKFLLDDKTLDNIMDSIAFSEKFKQFRDFLDTKMNEVIAEHVIQDCVKQVRLRKKINMLFENYFELDKVLTEIKDGSFDSIDDLVEDYENTIRHLYLNMVGANRVIEIEAAASLDLVQDDYKNVVDMIIKKYDRTNKTPTGFSYIDNSVLYGGYEPSRLYIWGGGSGAGKSTILNNSILYSAQKHVPKSDSIENVYIYITCENTIEEALIRTYTPLFNCTANQMLADISRGVNIKEKIQKELQKHGCTIVMKYFPGGTITTFDIMRVIDEVSERYSNSKIAGVYIDYLDLLRADTRYDMYRLELGHITLSLKTLAVQYNLPVITATQLGRSVYRVSQPEQLNVDQISESIKKIEHADFVALLVRDQVDESVVHAKVGKNRSGKSNVLLKFKVDFSKFKYLNVTSATVGKVSSENPKSNPSISFSGLTML